MQRLITTHVDDKLFGKQKFDDCSRWRVSVLHINIFFPKNYHHGVPGQIFSVDDCRNSQVQMQKMLRRIWSAFTNSYLCHYTYVFLSYFARYYNCNSINVQHLNSLFVIFLVRSLTSNVCFFPGSVWIAT